MRTPSRRRFLRDSLVASGGLLALGGMNPFGRLAHAQANNPDAPDRFYVFCYFRGGWDILLSLDPRDPQRFNDGNLRQKLIQPGYELLQGTDGRLVDAGGVTFGPHIGDLRRHVDRLAVIRGMSMETLTHEVGMRRFLTGKPPSGLQARGSTGSTWLAARLGEQEPIPNLALQVEAYNKGLPNFATALGVNSVDDLLRALRPADPQLEPLVARQHDLLLRDAARCNVARGEVANFSDFWQAAEGARKKAAQMVNGGLDSLFDFQARTPEMQALRDHYGIVGRASTPEVQAALAAQAITGGVCRTVSIQLAAQSLDTHFVDWTTDQGPTQERGFNAVARLMEDLASREYGGGESWLDRTTIVGFSEFSRTALLNERGGRDHSLTNACFVAGGNVRGGTVIGASSDVGMAPTKTNLVTGAPDPEGEVVRPEHVLQTLFDEVGIGDEADMRVTGIPRLMRA